MAIEIACRTSALSKPALVFAKSRPSWYMPHSWNSTVAMSELPCKFAKSCGAGPSSASMFFESSSCARLAGSGSTTNSSPSR